jgi:hypothetical protein
VADVEVLRVGSISVPPCSNSIICSTFMPSSEKHGGTAELSSSASERRMGNFSTADIGISPL